MRPPTPKHVHTLVLSVALLAGCVQKPEVVVPETTYDRMAFSGWIDTDDDCQNTRAEMLIAASASPVELRPSGCTVAEGSWLDPYTGRTFYDASDVQIDHLVPLAWAWPRGASEWTERKADRFALDPDNLRIVSASENRTKSAQGPLEWLPPNRGYHCTYVSDFVAVVEEYDLSLSPTEARRLARLKARICANV